MPRTKKEPPLRTVTCKKCGWVHMQVSLEHAETDVAKFNEYYDKLEPVKQQDYYGGRKASLSNYLSCMFCGGSYKNFRNSKDGDCPDGCTINPILNRNEEI